MLEELAKSQMAVEKWVGHEQDLKHVRASYYVEVLQGACLRVELRPCRRPKFGPLTR